MKELFNVSMGNRSHFVTFKSCVFRHVLSTSMLGPCLLRRKNVIFRLCLLHEEGIVEAHTPGSI